MPYSNPRLVRLYDVDNPDGADHDFFRELVNEVEAPRVVDLGCGTGILTVTLAQPGRKVLGIDPSKGMLDFARSRPGGDTVTWLEGTAATIEPRSADVIIMSGNVAMHILEDWPETLASIAAGLTERGVVAFESRNPEASAWRNWSDTGSERDTADGRLIESCSIEGPDVTGRVVMHIRKEWPDDGDIVEVKQELQFRSHQQILADLNRAGLTNVITYRNWSREPFTGGPGQPLMVFVARKD